MPLELQPSGVQHFPLVPVAEVAEIPAAYVADILAVNFRGREDAARHEHSPPDRQALYATFLI